MKKLFISLILTPLLLTSCGKDGDINQFNQIADQANDEVTPLLGTEDPTLRPIQGKEGSALSILNHNLKTYQTDFVEVTEYRNNELQSFNFNDLQEGAREINISAKDLIITKDSKYYQLLGGENGLNDTSKVTIHAETVLINAPIRLKSADLDIFAKNLELGPEGVINLSGIKYELPLGLSEAGRGGTDSGSLGLFVENFRNNSKEGYPILLAGGEGSDGGLGRDGNPGQNVPINRNVEGRAVVRYREEGCILDPPTPPSFGGMKRRDGLAICNFRNWHGVNLFSGNGENGIPAGVPGVGGKGGNITSNNKELEKIAVFKGGQSGQAGPNYKGGDAGKPIESCHLSNYQGGHADSWDCRTSLKGHDVNSPKAESEKGEKGEFYTEEKNWLTLGALEQMNAYAKEKFLQNKFEAAKKYYEFISYSADKLNNYDLKASFLKSSSLTNLKNLYTHKDYFGKQSGWVPHLSLEASIITFEKQLEESFKQLFLNYILSRRITNLNTTREAIGEQIAIKNEEQLSLNEQANELNDHLGKLKINLLALEQKESEFQQNLLALEESLKAFARDNIKIPHAKKAVALLGALSKAIPVGQPAFGIVGDGLDLLYNTFQAEDSVQYALKKYPSFYERVGDINFDGASDAWNTAYSQLDTTGFGDMKPKERLELLKRINKFNSPMIKAAFDTIETWKDREVQNSRFEEELLKLKAAHPVYQDITKQLSELMEKKLTLKGELEGYIQNLSLVVNGYQENILTLHNLHEIKNRKDAVHSPILIQYLKKLDEENKENLLKSYYQLVKAYEYRTLVPYKRSLNLKPLVDQAIKLAEEAQEREVKPEEFESFKGFYKSELQKIYNEALEGGFDYEKEGHIWIHLNDLQLKALQCEKEIFIDLGDYLENENMNARINKVEFDENLNFEVDDNPFLNGAFEITVRPLDFGVLENEGVRYLFRYDSEKIESTSTWGVSADIRSGSVDFIDPDRSWNGSLWRSYIGNNSFGIPFLSRVGANTVLKAKLKKRANSAFDLKLKDVKFKVNFSYR